MKLLDRIHSSYILPRRTRILSSHLAELIPAHAQILDVGCGDGLLAYLIQQRRPDIALNGVDVLVRRCTHIPVRWFDGKQIPFGDGSFDTVLIVDVLHHADDPALLLREAVRVARRGLVIKDHILTGLLAGPILRMMDRRGNEREGVALPFNYWTRQQWLEAFAGLDLQIGVWKSKLGLYPPPVNAICGRSLHFVARLDRKNEGALTRSAPRGLERIGSHLP